MAFPVSTPMSDRSDQVGPNSAERMRLGFERQHLEAATGGDVQWMESINSIDDDQPILDQLPQAKPPVTSHDRLWADLEELDSDADRAKLVQQQRGFLGIEHANRLKQLRDLQIAIAEEMTREEGNVGLEHYRELWSIGDPDELYSRLYDDRNFDLLNEHVARTAAKLDKIAAIIDASELSEADHPHQEKGSVDESDEVAHHQSFVQ